MPVGEALVAAGVIPSLSPGLRLTLPSHSRSLTAAFAFAAPLAAAAPPSQINIHYTQTPGTLSVDFVSQAADGVVQFGASANPESFKNSTTSSFAFNEVGVLHQGLMAFAAAPAGASGFYRVCSGGECSTVNHVVPNVAAGQERFAVFGDFGIINDESMTDLIAQAAKGSYDSVLHVGDWAYDLDALASTVGNAFMETATYMAIKPVAVVEGNHEACPLCLQNVPEIPYSVGNFTVRFLSFSFFSPSATPHCCAPPAILTFAIPPRSLLQHYKARFHSVSLNSNTGNNRYYSFNRGLTHFLVFTAEAYVYSVSAVFNANMVAFMKADLAAVDRKRTPWVVALVHKDWTMQANAYADFNNVLESGGVDLLFCGHVHYYNR
jgi:hypothetical protein